VNSPDDRPTIVAAFDLDKTLTSRDCVLPFLWTIGRWKFVFASTYRLPKLVFAALRRDRDRAKQILTRSALTGRPIAAVEARAEDFARRVQSSWLRSDTVARLEWHVASGHEVVIVSASYETYVQVLADRFGARAALATRLVVDESGRCTGELLGPNCRGAEKAQRLRSWLEERRISAATVYAYGDSAGDRQLLAMATHPHWIGKNRIADRPEAMT
jgi:phosphatidylglycerophosphatase C